MVIGPVNHIYIWGAFIKEYCTAIVLQVSNPMPQRSSRKGVALGAWFSEPPNKALAGYERIMLMITRKAF